MKRRILIVGGGYAGVICANRLARKSRAACCTEIVLADPRPWFIDRIRLHEEVAGAAPRRTPHASMLDASRVKLRVASVTELDLVRRRATFDGAVNGGDAREEDFDEPILATGSADATRGVAGIEHAWSCAAAEQATALRARLDQSPGARVVVIGAGLTGIELASELAERGGGLRVTLIATGSVGALLSEMGREHVRRSLQGLGVELREDAQVVAIEKAGVVLVSGDSIASDVTVWCGGFEAAPLAGRSGLAVDDLGRALVDARLRSRSHDFVRVIGDAAHVDWRRRDGSVTPLRMAGGRSARCSHRGTRDDRRWTTADQGHDPRLRERAEPPVRRRLSDAR